MSPLPSPRHPSYTRYDGAGRRDLKLVIPSLVIGLCLGAGGVYLGHSLPLQQNLLKAQSDLAITQDLCRKDSALSNETLETALHQLTICQADLQVARRRAVPAPTAPILTTPVPPASELPEALQGAAAEEAPPSTSLPVVPKPPPGRMTATDTTPETPSERPGETPAAEIAPVPPAPSLAVWPEHWPNKPLPRPARAAPPAQTEDEAEDDSQLIPPSVSEPAAAPLAPVSGHGAGRVNVGQEVTLAGNLRVRLIAVSQRTSGKYCVVAGDGFDSARIASGTSKRISRGSQTLTLSARVEDGDTCQLSVSSR